VASPLPWELFSARLMHGRSKVTRIRIVPAMLRQVRNVLQSYLYFSDYTRCHKTSC